MTRRTQPMPTLREGCFPAEGWQNPPHEYHRQPDGAYVTEIHPEQYDTLPVFTDIHAEPIWLTGNTVYQVCTGNGWSCYVASALAVVELLSLAASGRDGLLLWMLGHNPEAAATKALEIWQNEQEECQRRRAERPSPPDLDLDLDIDI